VGFGSWWHFCACVSHPLADVGRFVNDTAVAAYVVRDDYLTNRRVEDKVDRDGLEMTFRGWTYFPDDYVLAFEKAGLLIETMREPRPAGKSLRYLRWNRVPMFLLLRAIARYNPSPTPPAPLTTGE
jgi:hypothetical protein